jgi:hypothetical protein
VLALGQKLVSEFGGASQADTLSQWMAHHLAEKLTALKAATGPRKQQLEQGCRDSVLQIWKHRASFPYDHRPFKNFDAVFRALESLDPAKERNRYVRFNIPDQTPPESQPDLVQAWLDAAISIDRGARAVIRAYLDSAVAEATKGKDGWIKAVRALVHNDEADVQIIFKIIDKIEKPT